MKQLPKLTLQTATGATLESGWQTLENYRTASVIFAVSDKPVRAKLQGKLGEDGEAKNIKFLYRGEEETEFKEADADGVTLETAGQYVAVVIDGFLAHNEFDRIKLTLTTEDGGEVGTVCFALTEPRYSGNE